MSLIVCCFGMLCFFFFKQKTAYEMRISDWSSDVCSSDLPPRRHSHPTWRARLLRVWTRPRSSCPRRRRSPGHRCACPSDAPKAAGGFPSAHEARCGCAGGAFRKEKDPWSSLLLPFLAEDVLAAILDALALVRLGLAPATDLGRDLTHLLLVDPRNLDRGLIGGLDLDPLGHREIDRKSVV